MHVKHLQSSTQIVELGTTKVLTDPWLTPGEYYGSWYHYPPFEPQEISELEYDYIYVSHIHPDHLSEKTFSSLPYKKPVLIHNYDSKFVKRKLEMFGYEVIECDNAVPFEFQNGGSITIYAADNCDPQLCGKFLGCGIVEKKFGSTQIDTLAVFKFDGQVVINTNDCPFELAGETIRRNNLDSLEIDLLMVGYGGAGPYPQCFVFESEELKIEAGLRKEKQFLDQAIKYINLLKPKSYAPFAGTYVLGSRLAELTRYRGVPTVEEAITYIDEKIGGLSRSFNLGKLDIFDVGLGVLIKSNQIIDQSKEDYLKLIASLPLDYDTDVWDDSELPELLTQAHARFMSKASEIGFESSTRVCIESGNFAFVFSTTDIPEIVPVGSLPVEPFVKINVDHHLLHRLLRGPKYAHWNNAEIGSHLTYLRKPDFFERGLFHSLCFLHV